MKQRKPVKRQRSKADFRFDDARLCFGFAGTLGQRGTEQPLERFQNPDDLARWSVESGSVQTAPRCTIADLVRAKELRESIQNIGEALAKATSPSRNDIATVNRFALKPPPAPILTTDGKSIRWTDGSIDAVLSAVARDIIALCASPLRERVHLCGNESCGVPFVDTSRAGIRRWCSMRTCGALLKKRAYRSRKQATSSISD